MTEKPEKYSSDSIDATGEFFSVGVPLHAVRPGYVRRPADELLYQTLVSGSYAHVVAPDRTGKSSLIAATSARLQNNGVKVAVLDLAQIAERDGGVDAGRWYYSIAYRLLRQLRLKIDLQDWWQDKSILSNRQRLVEFYIEVILQNINDPVVVFVDEIQLVAERPFGEHLLASIRAAHNARSTEPEFSRLSFALVGECDPQSLLDDAAISPFAVSQEILLGDFSREDLNIFSTELNLTPAESQTALDSIFAWTNGHPYLSQKLARSVARERVAGDIPGNVDRIAMQQLAGRAALHSEPHMSHIHRQVMADKKNYEALLNMYGKMCKGIDVPYDSESRLQRAIFATGLVFVDSDGCLAIRNKVYATVFTARWANTNLPIRWRGPALAVAVILVVTALPFWYTQLLPRPYMQIMFSATLDLETVSDAYRNLRSFPGHVDSADRLYKTFISSRAIRATDADSIMRIERYARQLPNEEQFASGLVAEYWDRQVGKATRSESRDDALMAALESMIVSSPSRRRRAATLIGDDYPQLIGTIPPVNSQATVFNPDEMMLTTVDGAQMSQWSLQNQAIKKREPWLISALEVTPLVRRVVVDRDGQVGRIGLTINVAHARLSDLRLKIIAPSGRASDLIFEASASPSNEEIRFSQEHLAALIGEPLNGTWSLSIRDEGGGVTGHLIAWNLNLNSQVVVENFERGLDIPDPVERESDDLWLSPDGRFAIARAMQSDSARIWDLTYAQAARTIPVPASERVLGLSSNAEFLITVAVDAVNMWSTANGRRFATLETGSGSSEALLSSGGESMLVRRQGESDTDFELWSLSDGQMTANITVAGVPSLVAIDAGGTHIALADYDRSVRIWNLNSSELLSQFDLALQPSEILLSADGQSLGVVHGSQGLSMWRTDDTERPLLQMRGAGDWRISFSRSGARVLAGNSSDGYQVFSSIDGSASGPSLGSGIAPGRTGLVAFSSDERFVVTTAENGLTRLWQAPLAVSTVTQQGTSDRSSGQQLWRDSGESVVAMSPGGEWLAIGDRDGHVHIVPADAGVGQISDADDEISFLGHRAGVVRLIFSSDGSLVASVGSDGSIRVWDAHSGLPRPYYASWSAPNVDRMAFSASGSSLAALSGQRLWIMNVESGTVLADLDLGERHSGIVFAEDDVVYVAGESGTLRTLTADRGGSWNIRNVWAGTAPLRNLQISADRHRLIIVDATHRAQVLNIATGRVGDVTMQLPAAPVDIAVSPSNTRALFHTPGWIHRAGISARGLNWLDAIRAPKSMPGSSIAFDRPKTQGRVNAGSASIGDTAGDHVLILTRDTGFAEIAELQLSYGTGMALLGNKDALVLEWRSRLGRLLDFDAPATPP